MSVNLTGRHFVSVKDFSAEAFRQVLDTADQLKAENQRGHAHPLLAGKTMAMIFQKPSLRTRMSFETGMTQLGGHAIYLGPTDISLGVRETVEDIAIVLSRYADVIMARVFGHELVAGLAEHATVPVINGLSDLEHPCQILADLQTVREKKGTLAGVRMVYSGDGNNIAHSLMYGCALSGTHLTVVTPKGYEPDAAILKESQEIGTTYGATINVSNDLSASAKGADVIYTDVWASMGQEAEAEERKSIFMPYQVNMDLLAKADSECVVLHCLPAHYDEEITYDASRSRNSAIFDQAENRMHAQKALIALIGG